MTNPNPPRTAEDWNERSKGRLPGYLGVVILDIKAGEASGRLEIQPHHVAPNGYLHAATVIALADTLAGYGCVMSLPEGATGFTTVEIKSNFVGTAREGAIVARSWLVHGGRTTQVWDTEVRDESTDRPIALFRCTQMVLR